MGNINVMHIANETPEGKILRPLPNRLGHNPNPYYGGLHSDVERDCQRIEGHSDLFRELESFESDMEKAVIGQWQSIRELNLMIAGIETGTESIEDVLNEAVTRLSVTFQYLQEAFWIAEVLDDREQVRLAQRDNKDFMDLVATTDPSTMDGIAKGAECARVEWMISRLLDRTAQLQGWARMEWPQYGRAEWQDHLARLEKAMQGGIEVSRLQDMSDEELGDTLRTMEERVRTIRKTITMVHAVRTVRNG